MGYGIAFQEIRVQFVIGDVRDESTGRALEGKSRSPCGSYKIVPTAEYNPTECIKTNINGAMNVIEAAQEAKVTCCRTLYRQSV